MKWNLVTLGAVTLWRPDDTPPDCVIAATTRLGGVSDPPYDRLNLGRSTADLPGAIDENRRRVLEALGFSVSRLATALRCAATTFQATSACRVTSAVRPVW